MRNILTFIMLAATLASCGTRTSSYMTDNRHAVITGRGNAFVGQGDVMGANLAEAAKITLKSGFRYFSITSSQDRTRTGVIYTPGHSYTQGYVSGTVDVGGGFSGSYHGTTTTTPGEAIPYVKPGMDLMITMYTAEEVHPGDGLWDANQIMASHTDDGTEGSLRSVFQSMPF